MLRSYGPRAHVGSWKTAGFENEPSLFYLYILWITHKLMKIEVLRPVSWRNTTKHVNCDSVDEQRDSEN
jgi:hypothetical protein